jgi:hypothetical protein
MVEEFVTHNHKRHNPSPDLTVGQGGTNRHQGRLESMAFYLLGVECAHGTLRDVLTASALIPEHKNREGGDL